MRRGVLVVGAASRAPTRRSAYMIKSGTPFVNAMRGTSSKTGEHTGSPLRPNGNRQCVARDAPVGRLAAFLTGALATQVTLRARIVSGGYRFEDVKAVAMSTRATKPAGRSQRSGKSKTHRTARPKGAPTRDVVEAVDAELLALIADRPALMRCSERCPWHGACEHARSYSGRTCPVEGKRYVETVAWWVRYCLGRHASLDFLVMRLIGDIAAVTVQIERAERYTGERGFFYEQRKEKEGSDMVRLQIQPIVDQINRLYERRRRDVRDIQKYLMQTGRKQPDSQQEAATLAQTIADFLRQAKPLLYASLVASDGKKDVSLDDWTYPGDTPEEAERCRREARRILAMLEKAGAA